jgi:hypothetical protein
VVLCDNEYLQGDWAVGSAGGVTDGSFTDFALTRIVAAGIASVVETCSWENDGECDVPMYCAPGTDTADCRSEDTAELQAARTIDYSHLTRELLDGGSPRTITPAPLFSGVLAVGTPLTVIGHPSGLPRKYTGGATVQYVAECQLETLCPADGAAWGAYTADLDTFGGNSGSGTFTDAGEIVGILVSGATDFYYREGNYGAGGQPCRDFARCSDGVDSPLPHCRWYDFSARYPAACQVSSASSDCYQVCSGAGLEWVNCGGESVAPTAALINYMQGNPYLYPAGTFTVTDTTAAVVPEPEEEFSPFNFLAETCPAEVAACVAGGEPPVSECVEEVYYYDEDNPELTCTDGCYNDWAPSEGHDAACAMCAGWGHVCNCACGTPSACESELLAALESEEEEDPNLGSDELLAIVVCFDNRGDDPDWLGPFGDACDTYVSGMANHLWCVEDGAELWCPVACASAGSRADQIVDMCPDEVAACEADYSCSADLDTYFTSLTPLVDLPELVPELLAIECCANPSAPHCWSLDGEGDNPYWDGGWGGCETYAQGEQNHQYCIDDGADVACPVACAGALSREEQIAALCPDEMAACQATSSCVAELEVWVTSEQPWIDLPEPSADLQAIEACYYDIDEPTALEVLTEYCPIEVEACLAVVSCEDELTTAIEYNEQTGELPSTMSDELLAIAACFLDPCVGGVTLVDAGTLAHGNLLDNMACVWELQCSDASLAPHLTFTEFHTEAHYDFLYVYDSLETSGNNFALHGATTPDPLAVSGSSATVVYSSDGSVTGDGFRAEFSCGTPASSGPTQSHADDPCTGGVTLTDSGSVVHSSQSMSTNQVCSWMLQCSNSGHVPVLEFSTFHTEQFFDYLSLYDGEFPFDELALLHGSGPAGAYAASMSSMDVEYTSDGSVNGGGFAATFTCQDASAFEPSAGTDPCLTGVTLTDSGTVSHTNMEPNNVCQWVLSCSDATLVPQLTFTLLDTGMKHTFRIVRHARAAFRSWRAFLTTDSVLQFPQRRTTTSSMCLTRLIAPGLRTVCMVLSHRRSPSSRQNLKRLCFTHRTVRTACFYCVLGCFCLRRSQRD